jgi:hypothetical protein
MKKIIFTILLLTCPVFAQDSPKLEPKTLTVEEQAKLAELQKRSEQIQIAMEMLKKADD